VSDTRLFQGEGDRGGGDEYTYRDPLLSLWQSAADYVGTSALGKVLETEDRRNHVVRGLTAPVHAVHRQAKRILERGRHIFSEAADFADVAEGCARLAANFLWAEIRHHKKEADQIADELRKSECDLPGWSECLTQYLKYKAERGRNPYRADRDIEKQLPDPARIAIIGDWGTGERPAVRLLQAIKDTEKPNVLIHLGDIYYAGTEKETNENFLQICRGVLGPNFPLYSLCGNHDMYSGGAAYYSLLDHIGQEASYFCLRNQNWQLLAMDTGNRDHNPVTVATNMTSLNEAEIGWHLEKFRTAGDRKTVLLSHHQLFSPFASVGDFDHHKKFAYNPNLYSAFGDVLRDVEWWFWGHEHTLAIYDRYMGLNRGRCVGCSAIPVFKSQQSYVTDKGLETSVPGQFPAWNPDAQLGNNGTDYNHAFAMLVLDGRKATATYYEIPVGSTAPTPLFVE
jgi:predicted phosphodiesterase